MFISRIAVILAALLLCSHPVGASKIKAGDLVSYNKADHPSSAMRSAASPAEDRELAAKRTEFGRFVYEKVREFNNNLRFNKDRMQITKLADGSYLARYHQIEKTSLASSIRRSQAKTSPYVGILSYREQVYEAHGKNPADCRDGDFSLVQIIPNRHIFCYSKGTWR